MIQINLLPPEYRPRAGTPVARFAAILAGVVLVASASGVYAYTHFIELSRVKELKVARDEELAAKTKLRERSLELQREIKIYENRRQAIQTINKSRTLWSRKLDQFFDIVTAQGNPDAYLCWLESVEVPTQLAARTRRGAMRGRAKGQPAGELRFDAHLGMDDNRKALMLSSTFHKALTGDPEVTGQPTEFFADFQSITNPGIDIQPTRGKIELIPPVVGDFKYQLKLHPLDHKSKGK
ncbi:MAG: hypothetical protein QNJ98_04045 [Planctomycetota bacterium]|nr:hypothetical protein [Planctomycetota bacterium]